MRATTTEAALATLDRRWRRAGFGSSAREAMVPVARLALADPARKRRMTAELRHFQTVLPYELGLEPVRPEIVRVLTGAAVGFTGAAELCARTAPWLHVQLTKHVQLPGHYPVAGPVTAILACTAVTVAAVVLGAWLALLGRPKRTTTVRRTIMTVPAAAAVVALPVVAIGTVMFSNVVGSAVLALGLVVVVEADVLVRARRWALMQPA